MVFWDRRSAICGFGLLGARQAKFTMRSGARAARVPRACAIRKQSCQRTRPPPCRRPARALARARARAPAPRPLERREQTVSFSRKSQIDRRGVLPRRRHRRRRRRRRRHRRSQSFESRGSAARSWAPARGSAPVSDSTRAERSWARAWDRASSRSEFARRAPKARRPRRRFRRRPLKRRSSSRPRSPPARTIVSSHCGGATLASNSRCAPSHLYFCHRRHRACDSYLSLLSARGGRSRLRTSA